MPNECTVQIMRSLHPERITDSLKKLVQIHSWKTSRVLLLARVQSLVHTRPQRSVLSLALALLRLAVVDEIEDPAGQARNLAFALAIDRSVIVIVLVIGRTGRRLWRARVRRRWR